MQYACLLPGLRNLGRLEKIAQQRLIGLQPLRCLLADRLQKVQHEHIRSHHTAILPQDRELAQQLLCKPSVGGHITYLLLCRVAAFTGSVNSLN